MRRVAWSFQIGSQWLLMRPPLSLLQSRCCSLVQVCLMLDEKTRWKHVQAVLRRPDFRERVCAVDPTRVSARAEMVAEQLSLSSDDLTPLLRIKDLGRFPAVISTWTVAMLHMLDKLRQQRRAAGAK